VVLVVGLAAIGLIGVVLTPHRRSETEVGPRAPAVVATVAPDRPIDPNDLGVRDPSAVDPMDVLGRARTRALAWSRDALLVSLRAQPVLSGRVNLASGGTIEYWFGKPTGEGFGAGAKVAGRRLHLTLTSGGTQVDEAPAGGGRAALEPNCPLDEAVRKAQAAGMPLGTPVSVGYEMDDKHKKPAWRVSVTGDDSLTRVLDGWTCAILIR
jgi:hypothetical protein